MFQRRQDVDGSARGRRGVAIAAVVVVIASGLVVLAAPLARPARASTTFTVTSTADVVGITTTDGTCKTATTSAAGGACTLRAAVQKANSEPGADTIVLAAGATYQLSIPKPSATSEDGSAAVGDLDITSAVTIVGNRATIDASGLDPDGSGPLAGDRAIRISGSGASAAISDITISGGNSALGGGAISAQGPLTLDRALIVGNQVTSAGAGGGGLLLASGSSSSTVSSTVFIANSGPKGGAVRLNTGVSASLKWSTLSFNKATSATWGHGLVLANGASLDVTGTIFDDPNAAAPAPQSNDCSNQGSLTSSGNNIALDASCITTNSNKADLASTDPLLGPALFPVYPQAGSLAIDTATLAAAPCPGLDEAGNGRPRKGACDKGALEPAITVASTADVVDSDVTDGECKTVNVPPSNGLCTLRAAIMQANAASNPGPDTIILSNTTYGLTIVKPNPAAEDGSAATGDLDITSPITIAGNGATISATGLDPVGPTVGDRIFRIWGAGASATIAHVTLTGGNSALGGGAIQAQGPLVLDSSRIVGNQVSSTGSGGGGVLLAGGSNGSTITTTEFLGNSAPKGGAIRLNTGVTGAQLSWSTLSGNLATLANWGHGVVLSASASLQLTATVFNDPNPASPAPQSTDCSNQGSITTGGRNLARDASCVANNSGIGDVASTDPKLDTAGADATPLAGSPAVDTGGSICPRTDAVGAVRPSYAACDKGALEYIDPVGKDILERSRVLFVPLTGAAGTAQTIDPKYIDDALYKIYAAYVTGHDGDAEALVDAIANTSFGGLTYPNNGGGWPWRFSGELAFSLMGRLVAVTPPAKWRANPGDPHRARVLSWLSHLATTACVESAEFPSGNVWKWNGAPDSENYQFTRRTTCLYALYLTAADPNDPNAAWRAWATDVKRFIGQSAKAGTLHEVNSPSYSVITVPAIVDLSEFPGDAGLRTMAKNFLDLYWHDVALNFTAATKVAGVGGVRFYGPGPDAPDPLTSSFELRYYQTWGSGMAQMAGLYHWNPDWNGVLSDGGVRATILAAATSTYRPLQISTDLALSTGKDYTYESVRPRRVDGTNDTPHYIVRDVTANDDYTIGGEGHAYVDNSGNPVKYVNENSIFDVAINHERHERIVVASVGELKASAYESYASVNSINGVVHGDALIAARDGYAEDALNWGNSRGVGVYVSGANLQANLQPADPLDHSGWWFTQAGGAYAAIRLGDAPMERTVPTGSAPLEKDLLLIDDDGPDTVAGGGQCSTFPGGSTPGFSSTDCCNSMSSIDAYDCDAPIVVQMAQSKDFVTKPGCSADPFACFKNAVLAPPDPAQPAVPRYRKSVDAATGAVTNVSYTMLDGTVLEMARQEAPFPAGITGPTVPKIKTTAPGATLQPVNYTPAKPYLATGYIDSAVLATEVDITLWGPLGPSGPSVNLAFPTT